MELTMTRALIRRRNLKRKVSVLVLGTALISGTAFASAQVFVSGGWNTCYVERFNPKISKATGHDNAKINRKHQSWVKVGSSKNIKPVYSSVTGANKISYATQVGAWNAPVFCSQSSLCQLLISLKIMRRTNKLQKILMCKVIGKFIFLLPLLTMKR